MANTFGHATVGSLKLKIDSGITVAPAAWDGPLPPWGTKLFPRVVTMDDVEHLKPHPEGLLRLLDGSDPCEALYLGDNLDDALAAKRAGIPFLGVLRRGSEARRVRAAQLRRHSARIILHSANELEKYWK